MEQVSSRWTFVLKFVFPAVGVPEDHPVTTLLRQRAGATNTATRA
jgi:hypothetical protein